MNLIIVGGETAGWLTALYLNRISPSDLDLLLQKKSEFLLIDLRENYELEIDGKVSVENFAACDPYQLMADSMSRRIRGGEGWLMPHSQSIAFAEVFERAFEVMGRP